MSSHIQKTTSLIQRLGQLYPQYTQADLLRMALLITLHPSDRSANCGLIESASDEDSESAVAVASANTESLRRDSYQISMQLNAASDQHAALAEELDGLAALTPCDFAPEHLFALVRGLRVQSRMLDLYLGPEEVRCYRIN